MLSPPTCATKALRLSLFTAMAKSSQVQVLLWYSRHGSTRFRSPQSTLFFSPWAGGGSGRVGQGPGTPPPVRPHPRLLTL